MEFLIEFFSSDYMPHGHCFLWLPGILWLTVGADALIAISYFSIPIALLIFLQKRPDIQFRGIALLFAAFILLCGITHLFSIYTIWYGSYGVMAILKAMTAIVSFATAVATFRYIKPALSIPTPEQHEQALRERFVREREIEQLKLEKRFDSLVRAAIDFTPSGVLIIRATGELVYANKEVERLFGYDENQLVGQHIESLILEQDRSGHLMHFSRFFSHSDAPQAMAKGRVVQGRKANGESVHLEVGLVPKSIDGEKFVFASIIGVNEVLNLEETVVTQSSRLLRAIEAADEGIWEWNVQNGDVWYSPRLLELIGFDPASQGYSLDDWLGHIHPDDKSKVSAVLQGHFEKRTPYLVEYRGKNSHGEYEWMQARGEARFDERDKPLFMYGTLASVKETVALSDQLEEQIAINDEISQDFINTFELAAVGIAHVSTEGNWLRVNQRLCDIVGYTEGELLTLTFQDITYTDDLEKDLSLLSELMNGKANSYALEKRCFHKGGHIVWVHLTVSVVRSEDKRTGEKKPEYFISVIQDISKRKEIEKELANSNAELERFAYAASHDLQEPLRKIMMFSDSLQERLQGELADEDAQYELSRIADAASRMKAMVSALMELSRAQRLEVTLQQINLEALLQDVTEQLDALIHERQANVRLIGGSTGLIIDKAAMLHVFQNLITNAIRYCPEEREPQIHISCEENQKEVVIRVKDNAGGIPENMHEAIFEPFRRLVTKSISGSGMGLSICQRIIERHGGTIKVEESNDQGSSFLICLPKN
ncbi:hypothetical protein A3765_17220 [Oleiphilus sp. HI0130]|nr:hypothetical protein A3765_17220 [Oleiphilus sp. HI0130]